MKKNNNIKTKKKKNKEKNNILKEILSSMKKGILKFFKDIKNNPKMAIVSLLNACGALCT